MDSSEDSYTCMGDCCQLYFSAHFFIRVFWENKFSLIYHMKQVNIFPYLKKIAKQALCCSLTSTKTSLRTVSQYKKEESACKQTNKQKREQHF